MKVKHLAILSFLIGKDKFDTETLACAEGLAAKALAKSPSPLSVMHIVFMNERILRFEVIRGASRPDQGGGNPADYGAYVLFHCMPAGLSDSIYIWGQSMDFDEYGVELAKRIVGGVFDRLRFPALGKMTLIACFAADGMGDSVADHLCNGLIQVCDPPSRRPLMVAAWDNYVTVSSKDNTGLKDRKFKKPQDLGRKVSMDNDKRVWGKVAAKKHKWIWTLEGSKYVRRLYSEAKSDSLIGHATSDGKVALVDGF